MGTAAVLVANRGEIAVRVLRAVSEAGLRSVAVYTEGDDAHARPADEAVRLGDYLDGGALIAAARGTGCVPAPRVRLSERGRGLRAPLCRGRGHVRRTHTRGAGGLRGQGPGP